MNALLVQDPAERLGGGPSPRDVDHGALKSHPFFDGVDWDGLLEREPPAQPPRQQLPPCTIDGANPDWLLEDVATELDEAQFHTCAPALRGRRDAVPDMLFIRCTLAAAPPRSSAFWPREAPSLRQSLPARPNCGASRPSMAAPSDMPHERFRTAFLRASETVLLCGTVSKRKGLFSKTRRVRFAAQTPTPMPGTCDVTAVALSPAAAVDGCAAPHVPGRGRAQAEGPRALVPDQAR